MVPGMPIEAGWLALGVAFGSGVLLLIFAAESAWLAAQVLLMPEWHESQSDAVDWPSVTVQLPLFNERQVVDRLIRSVASLDYPRERMMIQVLDDSTDDTTDRVARVLDALRADGFQVSHIRRTSRTGFKAGALAHGMALQESEAYAVFDADFVPPPDFLRRVMPMLMTGRTAAVQARWTHLNQHTSLYTRLQALALDVHFLVEQSARYRCGYWMNFNGTAGVWRREAIESAGGWSDDTITEDLDLSIRVQLGGWRIVYLGHLSVPAELPEEVRAIRNQQFRWSRGGAQTAAKLASAVFSSDAGARRKWHAAFLMFGHAVFPILLLMAAAGLFVPEEVVLRGASWLEASIRISWTATGLVCVAHLIALHRRNLSIAHMFRSAWLIPVLMVWTMGLTWQNTRAVIGGWLKRKTDFVRTPKGSAYGPAAVAGGGWHEMMIGLVFLMPLFLRTGQNPFFGLHTMLAAGLLLVGAATWMETILNTYERPSDR